MPSRRRLDISSLLCPPDQPPPTPPAPPAVSEPVVLAPHLCNPALAHPAPRPAPAPPPRSPPSPSSDLPRPHVDLIRPHPAPRSIDNLIHPSSQPPRHLHLPQAQAQSQDSPRPSTQPRPSSSSSSLAARSPAGGYAYPPVQSPVVSPLSGLSGYTSPHSPHLHRPSSSHVNRHSVSHRPSSSNSYPPPPSPHSGKMAFEALVHAATEERKKLSSGSPQDLAPPPVSPLFHRSTPRHHDSDHSLPSSYLRLSRPQYEEEYYHQEHGRLERLRDDELRERQLQEHRRRREMQEMDRQRLLEQQRLEKERLLAQQMLVEKMERQREQHRLQGEHEQRRREQQLEEQQRRRLQEDRLRLELERQRREEFELAEERRAVEEANQRKLEERRRFEEEQRRRSDERRLYEERLAAEERRREELLRAEEARHREERQSEDYKRREEEQQRVVEEQRRREEEYRRDEHFRRAEQERLLQARLRVEHDQRPLLARTHPDKPLSDPHHFPFSPSSARPLVSRSPPAVTPQSYHLHPPVPGPRKFDPGQIHYSVNHDIQSSTSPDGEPPLKRQRYSESPPLTRHVYPTIVALPPPISDDQPSYRHSSSTVRRPGSGQGKRLGLNDVIEREKDKEKEQDRSVDGHRIISPHSRRSPPGSQIGRATAAKKSDEARRADEAAAAAAMADVLKTDDVHVPVKKVDDIVHPSTSPSHSEPTKFFQEHTPIAFETRVHDLLPSRPRDDVSNKMSLDTVMNDQPEIHVKKEPLPTTPLHLLSQVKEQQMEPAPGLPSEGDPSKSTSAPSPDLNRAVTPTPTQPQESCEARNTKESSARQPQRDDAHEWLLEHYTKSPPSLQQSLKPSRSRSPSIGAGAIKSQAESKPPVRLLEVPKPVIALRSVSPDADAALERELAELMAEEDEGVPMHKHEPDDMDIDLAVAETLEDDKSKVSPMEIDGTDDGADEVENELLSLVDDRPSSTTTSSRKAAATTPPPALKPPSVKTSTEEGKRPSPTSNTSPIIRPPSTRPGSDRDSMPPPSAATVQKEKDDELTRKGDVSATSAQTAKKKKDAGSKVAAKSKSTNSAAINGQAVTSSKQQKTKATTTKKGKGVDTVSANGISAATASAVDVKTAARHGKLAGIKKAANNNLIASRSRSTSVMPTGSVDNEAEEKEEDEKEEPVDDKLYCVCKTKYDEDRFMIACDRCDEWYHTTCVNMPDLEVELVDQFFCPPCLERNPNSNLKTTYKQRCLNGLRHPDPDSPKACHKPARGAISKYCSDECGLKYMQSRIDAWAKKGGKKEELWESVKHAEKREGVAVCVDDRVKVDLEKKKKLTKIDRETERLQGLLNQVVKTCEEVHGSMEIVVWRERLLQLASERAEQIDQCGWDQRLCFGEEEWQDFGPSVLESYDDIKPVKDENGMQVDETEEDGEWWCHHQKSCKRHAGWQTLRYKDICKEREKKQELLTKLATRERQLRKRITDLVDPSSRKANERTSQASLKSSKLKMSNGHARSKGVADSLKKGKKRKAPPS